MYAYPDLVAGTCPYLYDANLLHILLYIIFRELDINLKLKNPHKPFSNFKVRCQTLLNSGNFEIMKLRALEDLKSIPIQYVAHLFILFYAI